MPDTPIDQAPDLTSIRMKAPTGTVPIPPAGYGQLHSPAPGELAIRLHDGSVVAVGGGGGGGEETIAGTGGIITTVAGSFWGGAGISIKPNTGLPIMLDGPVVGHLGAPFGVQVVTVPISSAELLALDTVPKALIAAPAGGELPLPTNMFLSFVPGPTAYNFLDSLLYQVYFEADGGPQVVGTIDVNTLIGNQFNATQMAGTFGGLIRRDLVTDRVLRLKSNIPVTDGDGTVIATLLWVPV